LSINDWFILTIHFIQRLSALYILSISKFSSVEYYGIDFTFRIIDNRQNALKKIVLRS
jgi:hypothetical protein